MLIKSDHDIRTELSAALAKAGLPIEKLVRHVKTLEDIFLEATAAAEEEYRRSMEEDEEYEEEGAESEASANESEASSENTKGQEETK